MEQLHYFAGIALWYLLAPSHLLVLLLLLGLVLTLFKRPVGRWLTAGVTIILLLIAAIPLEHFLLAPLEQRIRPPASIGDIDSIIVLGGGQRNLQSYQYPYSGYGQHSGRLIAAVALARTHKVPVVFVGGQLIQDNDSYFEAKSLDAIVQMAGLAPGQLIINNQSNDTYDNAKFARSIVEKNGFKRSLLITSAAHMPRALGVFNQQNVAVVPFPVEYQLERDRTWLTPTSLVRKLYLIEYATHEWLGLAKYYALGMSGSLFPKYPLENAQ